ncbi:MAG: galactokinase [Chloroflexota bacterium]|nr:galactokinase [Chloroflexota bacterium]MBI5705096.1 galactokinase [Chloroflexota bacterium]
MPRFFVLFVDDHHFAIDSNMPLIDRLATIYRQTFGDFPAHIVRAPGRVNLLGEHVDYNDGFVLPAAIDRATYIAFSPTNASHSTLLAVDFDQRASFSPASVRTKTQADSSPLPDWSLYPAGVMWALMEAGLSVPSMNAVFASDVPRGAGLSSSASVEMAFLLAWQTLGGWTLPPMQRALLGQKAENQYVGVNCGIMDQFASACGVEDRLLLLDCRSLEWKTIPLPKDVSIVIADTSVRRKLTSGEYNQRRAACEAAVRLLQQDLPHIQALRDISVEEFNRLAGKLPPEVRRRARHVVEEIERTRQAEALLEAGNIREFGRLMNECHVSLRDLYEVSCPELNAMVDIAQSLEGCYGARFTGAGFGGCTVNLVASEKAHEFSQALAERYEAETSLHPEIYISHASSGAALLK